MPTIPTDLAARSDRIQQPPPSDEGCLPDLRHSSLENNGKGQLSVKLPGKPTKVYLEGPVGFEPTTPGLKVRSSTAELRALAPSYPSLLSPRKPRRGCATPVCRDDASSPSKLDYRLLVGTFQLPARPWRINPLPQPANRYPLPRTVMIHAGLAGFSSIFSRRRPMWTSTVRVWSDSS